MDSLGQIPTLLVLLNQLQLDSLVLVLLHI